MENQEGESERKRKTASIIYYATELPRVLRREIKSEGKGDRYIRRRNLVISSWGWRDPPHWRLCNKRLSLPANSERWYNLHAKGIFFLQPLLLHFSVPFSRIAPRYSIYSWTFCKSSGKKFFATNFLFSWSWQRYSSSPLVQANASKLKVMHIRLTELARFCFLIDKGLD